MTRAPAVDICSTVAGICATIDGGTDSRPCASPNRTSPEVTARPPTFTGWPKSTMCANACETARWEAKSWNPVEATPWHVANRAVGGVGDAAERLQDVRVHLADERAEPGLLVDVLDDDDARRRHGQDVVPPVGAIVIAVADRRRRRTGMRAVTAWPTTGG